MYVIKIKLMGNKMRATCAELGIDESLRRDYKNNADDDARAFADSLAVPGSELLADKRHGNTYQFRYLEPIDYQGTPLGTNQAWWTYRQK